MRKIDGYTLVRWLASGATAYRPMWTMVHYVEVLQGQLSKTTLCHIEVNPERERVYDIPTSDVCKNCLR